MKVVAEGIESEEVWKSLQQLGCDEGQGFFMAKPMIPEEVLAWKERWQSKHVLIPSNVERKEHEE